MTRRSVYLLLLWLVGFFLPFLPFVIGFVLEYLELPWWSPYAGILGAVLLCGIAIGQSGMHAIVRALLMLGTLLGLGLELIVMWWILMCRHGFLMGTQ